MPKHYAYCAIICSAPVSGQRLHDILNYIKPFNININVV
jgi:hypothetical protein